MTTTTAEARAKALEARRQLLEALATGVYRVGWAAAKLVLLVLNVVAAPVFAAGWLTRRAFIPAGRWIAAAFMIGYEAGRRPGEKQERR